jgi:MerR family transcriptional regulator, light-induced transcriptional regulator
MADPYRLAAAALDSIRGQIAEAITNRHYELHPELAERFGPTGRLHCLQDAEYHLSYLSAAVAAGTPLFFSEYVRWCNAMLGARGIAAEHVAENIRIMREVLEVNLPPEVYAWALPPMDEGLAAFGRVSAAPSTLLPEGSGPVAQLARDYLSALLRAERHLASSLILGAAQAGTPIRDLYLQVFQPSQQEVGRLWQMNQITVAQEHYCTAATQLIMSQLYPFIFSGQRKNRTLLAACVAGDLHELGARVVSDLLEVEGWDTIYLGANVPGSSIIKMMQDRHIDVLALSATMTFHVTAVERLIAEIRRSQVRQPTKILVGGYPFNLAPELWKRVDADAWAPDAAQAIAVADRLASSVSTRP